MTKKRKPITGLVLSGGSSRVFAQLGVLKVLYSKGFRPDMIAGCSVGSLLGTLLASGKSLEEIEKWLFEQNPLRLLDIKFNRMGLIKGEKFVKAILDFSDAKTFEDLKIPLIVNATNINKGKNEFFSKGLLSNPLNASIAIPGIFQPKKIGTELYVDGGVTNPVPVDALKDADYIVAIDVSFFFKEITENSGASRVLSQSVYISQRSAFEGIMKKMENKQILLIKPPIEKYFIAEFRKEKYAEMMDIGIIQARRILSSKKNSEFIKKIYKNENKK
ncbi:patatin-like phospholipase family protein [Candidatus Woesearchaeota archaeon]|nr:patatin-like phospholipase family protein [Candidatus Woesearchaeota archaeon]MCF7900790.1 patatin-like phospholipase family protein [Candidatus Woesearchaeota archaeon]MCF8013092.1 patatin-like phospholipase family protein [Candidatus Woesearchaeota archaeon]